MVHQPVARDGFAFFSFQPVGEKRNARDEQDHTAAEESRGLRD